MRTKAFAYTWWFSNICRLFRICFLTEMFSVMSAIVDRGQRNMEVGKGNECYRRKASTRKEMERKVRW